MIIIQQTISGGGGGSSNVNVHDAAGNNIGSNAGYLFVELDPASQALLASIDATNNQIQTNTALNNTNNGILQDTSASVALTGSLTSLAPQPCKYVTLVNLSTNTADISYTVNGGATLTLEVGYSVRINTVNADLIEVSSAASEDLQYIITA